MLLECNAKSVEFSFKYTSSARCEGVQYIEWRAGQHFVMSCYLDKATLGGTPLFFLFYFLLFSALIRPTSHCFKRQHHVLWVITLSNICRVADTQKCALKAQTQALSSTSWFAVGQPWGMGRSVEGQTLELGSQTGYWTVSEWGNTFCHQHVCMSWKITVGTVFLILLHCLTVRSYFFPLKNLLPPLCNAVASPI